MIGPGSTAPSSLPKVPSTSGIPGDPIRTQPLLHPNHASFLITFLNRLPPWELKCVNFRQIDQTRTRHSRGRRIGKGCNLAFTGSTTLLDSGSRFTRPERRDPVIPACFKPESREAAIEHLLVPPAFPYPSLVNLARNDEKNLSPPGSLITLQVLICFYLSSSVFICGQLPLEPYR